MTPLSSVARLFLLFALALFLFLFFYMGFYSPKEEVLSALEQELGTLEQKALKLKSERQELQEALSKKQKPEIILPTELISSFPQTHNIPELLSSWTREGKKMGIEFLLFKPLEEKNWGPLIEMPIEITLRGTYQQTLNLFDYLSKSKRKILVSNIEMSRPQQKEGVYVISTHALATTFRRGE